ncbi:MAG: nucleotidyltransferase family protein [Bacteroidetes bacterium]|nr:MAG: nucleotidyltransferase family protein [Bacteroidota bacterium]
MNQTAAIVLAAGASRRLGQPKQALLHVGEPLLLRAARLARAAGAEPVIVVLGAYAAQLRPLLAGETVQIVENPDWEAGMGSSIRCGMAALPDTCEAVLFLVVDQPGLSVTHLQALLQATSGPYSMAASAYGQKLGVPAVFTARHFAALRTHEGPNGARQLLRSLPEQVARVPFPEGAWDIDRPEDLDRLSP